MSNIQFDAIGTSWEITSRDDFDIAPIQAEIADYDNYFSRFIPTSFISTLAKKKGIFEVREDLTTLLLMYLPLYHLTGGLFTPLIGQQLVEAGYDSNYSLKEKELHDIPALTDVIEVLDSTHIEVKQPVLLDIGAIGKGYLIDKVASMLKNGGQKEFLVDAGGDIIVHSESGVAKVIGLEHPDDSTMVLGTVPVCNQAICGSAGNRRKWGRFHHIINPKTHTSPEHILAVWVVANNTAIADGLSTALFFVKPEVLAKQYRFDYVIVYADGTFSSSSTFSGELFLSP
jgi:thiamine biosynthesis lipoprotein